MGPRLLSGQRRPPRGRSDHFVVANLLEHRMVISAGFAQGLERVHDVLSLDPATGNLGALSEMNSRGFGSLSTARGRP
jgi:hypothetical protein